MFNTVISGYSGPAGDFFRFDGEPLGEPFGFCVPCDRDHRAGTGCDRRSQAQEAAAKAGGRGSAYGRGPV